jgi:hypothetical protein
MQGITKSIFEGVATQKSIVFQVAINKLDGITAF